MTDNPPAFPVELAVGLEPGEESQTGLDHAQFPGMTLRDWFAGQVLSGMFASQWFTDHAAGDAGSLAANLAHNAYNFADAMLAARKGGLHD